MPSYSLGRKGSENTMDLALPSVNDDGEHNIVKVKKPNPTLLLKAGVLDDFDSLTSLVGMQINTSEAPGGAADVAAVKALAEHIESLEAGLLLMDKVIEFVVVEPRCLRPVHRGQEGKPLINSDDGKEIPLADHERDPGVFYTDDVDLDDKSFILQFAVGGIKDWEQFRREQTGLMGAVAAKPELSLSALATAADR